MEMLMDMLGVSKRTFKMTQTNSKKCHEMVRINVSWFGKCDPFFIFHDAVFSTYPENGNTKSLFLNRETKPILLLPLETISMRRFYENNFVVLACTPILQGIQLFTETTQVIKLLRHWSACNSNDRQTWFQCFVGTCLCAFITLPG